MVATLTAFLRPFESFTVVASHGWSTEDLERSKEQVRRMGWSTGTLNAKISICACVLKTMGSHWRCMNRIVSQYSDALERALWEQARRWFREEENQMQKDQLRGSRENPGEQHAKAWRGGINEKSFKIEVAAWVYRRRKQWVSSLVIGEAVMVPLTELGSRQWRNNRFSHSKTGSLSSRSLPGEVR